MKAIITGMNGTVAPVLNEALARQEVVVTPWDRSKVSPENDDEIEQFITDQQPDWVFHLAMGDPRWAAQMAAICAAQDIRFLFTSSVDVFSEEAKGPFSVSRATDATHDYGRYKIECEQRISAANPTAVIARLGWQIGKSSGSNNMVDFLITSLQDKGHIEASSRWFPACSFLQDTAKALIWMMQNPKVGIYQLDGNPGLSFREIVEALQAIHGGMWKIVPTETPARNNRMLDSRVRITPITKRLRLA